MKRRGLRRLEIICVLLLLMTLAAWALSYWFSWKLSGEGQIAGECKLAGGRIKIDIEAWNFDIWETRWTEQRDLPDEDDLRWSLQPGLTSFFFNAGIHYWTGRFGGFEMGHDLDYRQGNLRAAPEHYRLYVPLFCPSIGFAVVMLLCHRAIRRPLKPSLLVGRCVKCGYDLRATPDRCPECGTITHATAIVSAACVK